MAYCIQLDSVVPSEVLSDELQCICSVEEAPQPVVPAMIQTLVEEYDHLFATPTELPPVREADH